MLSVDVQTGRVLGLEHVHLDDTGQLQQRPGLFGQYEVIQGQPIALLAQVLQPAQQLVVHRYRLQHLDHQLITAGRQQIGLQQPLAGRVEEQQAVADQSLQADFVESGGTGPHRGGQPAVDLRMQAVRRGAIQHLVGSMLHFRVADGLQSDAVMGRGAD